MNREESAGLLSRLPKIAVFAVMGLTLTLLGLFCMAMLISGGALGANTEKFMTMICCALGTLLTGILAGLRQTKQVLFAGVAAGALYFLLLLIIGAVFLPSFWPETGMGIVACISLGGGIAGGLIGSMIH